MKEFLLIFKVMTVEIITEKATKNTIQYPSATIRDVNPIISNIFPYIAKNILIVEIYLSAIVEITLFETSLKSLFSKCSNGIFSIFEQYLILILSLKSILDISSL